MSALINFLATLSPQVRSSAGYHDFYTAMHDQIIDYTRTKTQSAIKDGSKLSMDLAQICSSMQNMLHQTFSDLSNFYLEKAVAGTPFKKKFEDVKPLITQEFDVLTSPLVIEVITLYFHEELMKSKTTQSSSIDEGEKVDKEDIDIAVVDEVKNTASEAFSSSRRLINDLLSKRNSKKTGGAIPQSSTSQLKKEASATVRFLTMLENYPPLEPMADSTATPKSADISVSRSSGDFSSQSRTQRTPSSSSYRKSSGSLGEPEQSMHSTTLQNDIKHIVKERAKRSESFRMLQTMAQATTATDDTSDTDAWEAIKLKATNPLRFFSRRALKKEIAPALELFIGEASDLIEKTNNLLTPKLNQLEQVSEALFADFPQEEHGLNVFFRKNEFLLTSIEQIATNAFIIMKEKITQAITHHSFLISQELDEESETLDTKIKEWNSFITVHPYIKFNRQIVDFKKGLEKRIAQSNKELCSLDQSRLNQIELLIFQMGDRCRAIMHQGDSPLAYFLKGVISETADRNTRRRHGQGSQILQDEIARVQSEIQQIKDYLLSPDLCSTASPEFEPLQKAFIEWSIDQGAQNTEDTFIALQEYMGKNKSIAKVINQLEDIRKRQWHLYLNWQQDMQLDKEWATEFKALESLDPVAYSLYCSWLVIDESNDKSVDYLNELNTANSNPSLQQQFIQFRYAFFDKRYNEKLDGLQSRLTRLQNQLNRTRSTEEIEEPSPFRRLNS